MKYHVILSMPRQVENIKIPQGQEAQTLSKIFEEVDRTYGPKTVNSQEFIMKKLLKDED